ncbi:DNA topoisomerase 1 [Orchesella cincta]|uniref:DNA topoisomerase I n=1 Tax=Orchesella cincta TaxID=48709 RepID=A0A1D2MQL0_ORCCI|nr:DNA topoisomerase 1 [Orchesella cincta]
METATLSYNHQNGSNDSVDSTTNNSKDNHSSSHHKKHKKEKHKKKHKHHDRDRSKERDRSSSHHHKSSSKDKEKEKSKDKHKSSSSTSSSKPSSKNNGDIVIKHERQDVSMSSANSSPVKNQNSRSVSRSPEKKLYAQPASDSEDDIPLSARAKVSAKTPKIKKEEPMSDDDVPLISRASTKKPAKKRARSQSSDDDDYSDGSDYGSKKKKKPVKKQKTSQNSRKSTPSSSQRSTPTSSPRKKVKKEEEQEVWKWWEEAPRDDGVKWNFLQHKGPVFAPPYDKLPKSVQFRYNGKVFKLSPDAEEIAGFYSRFIEHEYTTKEKFNHNFLKVIAHGFLFAKKVVSLLMAWGAAIKCCLPRSSPVLGMLAESNVLLIVRGTDWRKSMTSEERDLITDLKKCDFREINEYYKMKSEERKAMSKEEKQKIKEENENLVKEYGIAVIDGHKEKIGNFRIEPPGLFRGRGDHPKMGMLKRRVIPEDVIINCSKDSKWPEAPKGRKWKEVRHDNTVTWLACWTENVQGQQKYVMLNPTSRLKGEKDWMKYEKARELAKHIDKIRKTYMDDFKSKEMRVRQRATALYFIDKLALRAGNEKDEDQADTVGCCSLRYEHIQLIDEQDGKENIVVFDFLGKDSIRYYNEVPVEKRVYKNLKIFMENKKEGDDLFDRLNTTVLNKHLNELMSGLTAKVFRTYNASHTLQQQLDELTPENGSVAEKVLAYNRANRAVAILCNHQRAVPKTHEKSMENLVTKITNKKDEIKNVKQDLKNCGKGTKEHEKKTAQMKRLKEQLQKLELNKADKEEGKEIALGTSKLNYLDPRISVAWCKKWDVPIEKVYNKTQRDKFRWAIDMAESDYRFD